ncbi:MAG TPA: helix-turn-helix domain-containing protein [Nitrososphaeraceae archaeon]|nr:helix-turn-helix domain-containing protein [Nitrososphaeraceae archaeon]
MTSAIYSLLLLSCMAFARSELERLYKKRELDSDVKERLLLVIKVEGDDIIPARAAKELHRSRTWASDWLARYREEGIEGLRDRPKSGRPPKLSPEVVLRISKKLKESRQGWTTKQVNEMIVKEGGIQYHSHHIYRLLHKWGFKQKVPRKVHINTASEEEKQEFKKEHRES